GGAVLAGLLATALAELSSLFRAFDRSLVLGAWLAALLVLAAAVWRQSRRQAGAPPAVSIGRPSAQEIGFLLGLGVLAVAVVLAAAASAPSNWDSLTYHLPRIAHWIQNRSVAHYPTHVVRQLTLGPGAEELLAHFELLAGSDRGIGLLQFLAWVGAGVAASVVAADLGAGRVGQGFAAVFGLTLPMAVLQASSTQNDLVLSFWILAFVHFALASGDG